MISTLTYVSTLHGSIDRAELDALLQSSRQRNAKVGVTGLMLVRDRQVMQILEGEEAQVRGLYARIRQDPRHRDVTQVWRSSSQTRRFPDWSMGFEDLDNTDVDPADDVTSSHTSDISSGADSIGAGVAAAVQLSGDDRIFLNRRLVLLRRGLANGNRLVGALAVILDAHDAEATHQAGGPTGRSTQLQCRQGCNTDSLDKPAYPCPTALNAFWALDATI